MHLTTTLEIPVRSDSYNTYPNDLTLKIGEEYTTITEVGENREITLSNTILRALAIKFMQLTEES